jgi:hypothetical protein
MKFALPRLLRGGCTNIPRYVPTLDDLTVDIEELNRRIEAAEAKHKVRQERPWVRDIIRVLWGTKSWLSKDRLDRELWALRQPSGLNMPENFDRTVQSALNQHTSQSSVWERNGAKPEDDLSIPRRVKAPAPGQFIASVRLLGSKSGAFLGLDQLWLTNGFDLITSNPKRLSSSPIRGSPTATFT